jgi:hypothetical protein
MKQFSPTVALALAVGFAGGFCTHFFYQRWTSAGADFLAASRARSQSQGANFEPQTHRVNFAPLAAPKTAGAELPLLQARDVEKLRAVAGTQARVRGRIFRVGHSNKSNTFFLNFGPSREALTGVIFASAVELFAQRKVTPKDFEGREVEIEGVVREHPQFGLEIILEKPEQIRTVD